MSACRRTNFSGAWVHTSAVAVCVGALIAATPCDAQNGRSSFFVQMLRSNSESRVKVTAAIRLAEIRDPASVPALVEVLGSTRDGALQAAVVSALGAIGSVNALPALERIARGNGEVATQARRAIENIRASGSGSQNASGSSNSTASAAGASTKLLVTVGPVSNASGAAPQVVQAARQALQDTLSSRGEVLVHNGSASEAAQIMRTRRLIGHSFSPNIRVVQPNGTSVHVELNIAVSSYPGGALEFDSPSNITITSGQTDSGEATQRAVRLAITAAVGRALNQLVAPR